MQALTQAYYNMSIPTEYKAAVIHEKNGKFSIDTKKIPELKPDQVLLKVLANGVCSSDEFTVHDVKEFGCSLPRVPGHEIIGQIVKKGSLVPDVYKVGGRYGRGWFGGCCFSCENCRRGDFVSCDKNMVSGITDDGGYAEYVVAPWSSLAKVPDNLDSAEAAPLMCAGVTVFNALRNVSSKVKQPATVAVIGLGGLGHLALQFSNKMGYRTVAISSSDKKKDEALRLGAHEFIDGSKGDIGQQLQKLGGATVILATMNNSDLMSAAVNGLGTNGQLITIGASFDPIKAAPGQLIPGNKSICGHASGTSKDSEDTLLFASLFNVKPIIEKYSLNDAQKAFDSMDQGKAKYRAVIVPQ